MNPDNKLNDVTGSTEMREPNSPENGGALGQADAADSRPIDVSASSTETHKRNGSRSLTRKSTGPRTPAGREKSRHNAVKLGIFANAVLLRDESRLEFNSIWRGLRRTLKPVDSFGEALVELMTTNLWMQRRVLIAEAAAIEELRRGYVFKKDEHDPREKKVHLLVQYVGQEDHSALMQTTPPDELPPRQRCLQLLGELITGVRSSGFDGNRDAKIFKKLYGDPNNVNQRGRLIDSYQTWQSAANRSQEERLQRGSASPQECVEHFVKDVESEIKRLESERLIDLDRAQLRRLRQMVPDSHLSDHLLRRMTSLQRAFDRLWAQYERYQRTRLGHPLAAQIEVHHSLSRG